MSEPTGSLSLRVATVADDADRAVLGRIATGDLDALEELYDRYKTMAYSIAYRITNDATLAEDVVQEAFLGAWRNAHGQDELDELFASLGRSFSDCASYEFELQSYDVVGDMAYTAGLEHTSASVDGQPRTYTLRVTQVYRRESGEWRVAHRHGDTVTE